MSGPAKYKIKNPSDLKKWGTIFEDEDFKPRPQIKDDEWYPFMKWCAKNHRLESFWYHARLTTKDEKIISMISAKLHQQFKNLARWYEFETMVPPPMEKVEEVETKETGEEETRPNLG